jgi:putative phosphoesterase
MSTSVILIGDTHLPRFGRVLPEPLAQALQTTDLILHVGDITEPFVLDLLAAHAPVEAVAGNNDGQHLAQRLGHTRIVAVEEARIGMTHGHLGPGRTTPERARLTFRGPIDAVAFGHSHQPMTQRIGATWLLNPGSPTDRRRQPVFSFLRLEIDGTRIHPELVTYGTWR